MRKKIKRYRNRHHLTNRVNNGPTRKENLLYIDMEKHNLLHIIFKNLDLYEIIILLIRTARMKQYDKVNPKIKQLYKHLSL